jgi:phosphoribosyl-ATP pyrophosphohydrolase/phosphoribosyl-AMP cyclohydrolase
MIIADATQLDTLDFDRGGGLLTVVTQHALTGEILMLAWADRAALERTLADRVMWYWSRSRHRLWRKGETSGNVQRLVRLHADCDGDAVLALVLPAGPACHTGGRNCFDALPALAALDAVVADRAADTTHAGYTRRLLDDANLRWKKLGEETVELVLACAAADRERIAAEAADLLYHTLVACRAAGIGIEDVLAQLEARRAVTQAGAAAAGGRGAEG